MKKGLTVFMTVIAFVLLVGNVVLFRLARHFYTREAQVRLKPVGTPSWLENGTSSMPRVLMLGDSRVAQWSGFAAERFNTFNAGVGNETTAQIGLRAKESIERVKPAVIVIEAGINDLKTIPLMPNARKQIEDNCVEHIMEWIRLGRASGAAVVVLSVLPAGKVEWSRKLVWSGAVSEAVGNVNRRLAERCRGETAVRFLNLDAEVQIGRDYVDTLHFNKAFYERIAPLVVKAMEEVLPK